MKKDFYKIEKRHHVLFVTAFVSCALACAGGFLTSGGFVAGGIAVTAAAVSVIVLLSAVCAAANSVRIKRFSAMTKDERIEKINAIESEAARDHKKHCKKYVDCVIRAKIKAWIYLSCLIAVPFGINCALSGFDYSLWAFGASLIICFAYFIFPAWALIFLFPGDGDAETPPFLSRDVYPEIYKAADEALKGVIDKPVSVDFTPDFFVAITPGNTCAADVGAPLLRVLSCGEAVQIIRLYAKAQASVYDKSLSKRMAEASMWEMTSVIAENSFFKRLARNSVDNLVFCDLTSAEIYRNTLGTAIGEKLITESARSSEDKQTLVNAIAKELCLQLICDDWDYYCDRPYYAPEQPQADETEKMTDTLLSLLRKSPEEWIEKAVKLTPALYESGVSLKKLMEELGVNSVEIVLPDTDDAFTKETIAAQKYVDKTLCAERLQKGLQAYRAEREAFFVKPCQTVEAFELAGGLNNPDKSALSNTALRPVAEAYRALCRKEQAIEVCSYVAEHAEKDEDRDYALFILGKFALMQGDEKGVDMIERAMKCNSNYVASADVIERFYLAEGQPQKAEQARKKYRELALKAKKKAEFLDTIAPGEKIVAAKIDDSLKNAILDTIRKTGEDLVGSVYAVKKAKDDRFDCTFIILSFEGNNAVYRHEILTQVFFLLDSMPEQFSLLDMARLHPSVRKKITASGAKIFPEKSK